MDLPKLESMNKYQRKFPPTHIMIAHYLNMGDRSGKVDATDPDVNKESDLAELMAAFPRK